MKSSVSKVLIGIAIAFLLGTVASGLAWLIYALFGNLFIGMYESFGWLPGRGIDDGIRMSLLSICLLISFSFWTVQLFNFYYLRSKYNDSIVRAITSVSMYLIVLNFLLFYFFVLMGYEPPNWLIN